MPTQSGRRRLQPQSMDRIQELILVGWRESVALPELGIDCIQAKLDTGAAMSALHAENVQVIGKGSVRWVRFCAGESGQTLEECQSRLVGFRNIRSSNGQVESRPVIETILYMAGFQWPMEVTLTNRLSLECRMLIGRGALSDRCLVDCSRVGLISSRVLG